MEHHSANEEDDQWVILEEHPDAFRFAEMDQLIKFFKKAGLNKKPLFRGFLSLWINPFVCCSQ
jgi:hypothetical protein